MNEYIVSNYSYHLCMTVHGNACVTCVCAYLAVCCVWVHMIVCRRHYGLNELCRPFCRCKLALNAYFRRHKINISTRGPRVVHVSDLRSNGALIASFRSHLSRRIAFPRQLINSQSCRIPGSGSNHKQTKRGRNAAGNGSP